jgi:hypothetical protein
VLAQLVGDLDVHLLGHAQASSPPAPKNGRARPPALIRRG